MWPYYVMCALSLVFAACAKTIQARVSEQPMIFGKSKKIGRVECVSFLFLVLSGLPFFLVAACRYHVGTDYTVYLNLQVPEVMAGDYHRVELFYRYLIQFSTFLTDGRSYQMIFILTHLLIISLVFSAIRRLSWDYRFSVLILFLSGWYNFSLNIMRQSIAVAFFLYGIRYILEKKPVRYFITITVGVLFHTTAVIFYPVYFLCFFQMKKKYIIPLLAVCYVAKDYILIFVKNVATLLGYGKYFTNEFNFQTMQKGLLIYNIAFLVLIWIGLWYFHSEQEDMVELTTLRRYDNLLVNTQVLTTLMCLWAQIIPNSTRMIYSLVAAQIVLMPRVMRNQTGRNKWTFFLYRALILGVYIVMFIKMILIRNIGETNIYYSIFG